VVFPLFSPGPWSGFFTLSAFVFVFFSAPLHKKHSCSKLCYLCERYFSHPVYTFSMRPSQWVKLSCFFSFFLKRTSSSVCDFCPIFPPLHVLLFPGTFPQGIRDIVFFFLFFFRNPSFDWGLVFFALFPSAPVYCFFPWDFSPFFFVCNWIVSFVTLFLLRFIGYSGMYPSVCPSSDLIG